MTSSLPRSAQKDFERAVSLLQQGRLAIAEGICGELVARTVGGAPVDHAILDAAFFRLGLEQAEPAVVGVQHRDAGEEEDREQQLEALRVDEARLAGEERAALGRLDDGADLLARGRRVACLARTMTTG